MIAVIDRGQAAVDEGDPVGVAVHHGGQLGVRELVGGPRPGDGEAADDRAGFRVENDHLGAVERRHEQAGALDPVVMAVVVVLRLVVGVVALVVRVSSCAWLVVRMVIVLVVVRMVVVRRLVVLVCGTVREDLTDGLDGRAEGALRQRRARAVERQQEEDDRRT